MNTLLVNFKSWKTTVVGLAAGVALLAQNTAVLASPVLAHYVQLAAALAASAMLVFGANDPKSQG